MDVKVTRNYSVYQNAVNSGRHAEKSVSVPASADKKVRGDAICISSDGAKKSEASSFAAALRKSMDEGAPAGSNRGVKTAGVRRHVSGVGGTDCEKADERFIERERHWKN